MAADAPDRETDRRCSPKGTCEEDKVELVRAGIELARDGDVQMLKFFLDRILPRDRPVIITLPQIRSSETAADALLAIIQAVAAGEISPAEANSLANVVAGYHRFIDIAELEERLESSEARIEELDQQK